MNPQCYRCNKTVYPVEKLNCLDKYWHKGCFNCETCKLTLTMKTYKGYNKLPYCNTHYPTTKHTAVADTPESLRLAKNTQNQSTVVYHKEFEKERGKVIAVADDPETLRARKTQLQASDLAYQGVASQGPPAETHERSAPPQRRQSPPSSRHEPEPEPEEHHGGGHGKPDKVKYRAVYDYAAADEDEVSFNEGDIIVDGHVIDEGWMTGTVERTGEVGMLPSNYVELC